MGKRGPKPLSAEELELRGSWRATERRREELGLPPIKRKKLKTMGEHFRELRAAGLLP
jgi:hypothetical protein